jgi:hypothetical protein
MSPRSLTIALLAVAGLFRLGALAPRLEPAIRQELEASGELRGSLADGASPRLLPLLPRRAQILEEIRARQLTVGGMKGLEYYSASRKRLRTLFAESHLIDDPLNRRPIPDRTFPGEIPPVEQAYLYQEDLTFGGTVYRLEYYFDDGVLSLHTSNLTPMRYLGLPMIREGESLSWICLIPYGSNVLFYGLTGGKTMKFLGLEKSKSREESFYHRLKAIYGWYTRALGG